MEKRNSINFLETFKVNKKKVIIFLVFIILVYAFGCWVTHFSTKLASICPEGPEISYLDDKKMSGGQYCYRSIFIPFDNYYDHPNCCITLSDVIFNHVLILIIGLLFYASYSIIEFFIKRQKT
ncbi:MAG: hypothetical protein U9R19_08230 [Bacteroidota bacterium]|nr:hypothetical protein [Bacteroidota bacterium]